MNCTTVRDNHDIIYEFIFIKNSINLIKVLITHLQNQKLRLKLAEFDKSLEPSLNIKESPTVFSVY